MTKIPNVEWLSTSPQVRVVPPKKPKRITGTKLAAVLGQNPWKANSPFSAWCAITRTYEEPFKGNKYTKAGEVIEPALLDYLEQMYFGEGGVRRPKDVYGDDPFKATWGNFFPESDIFGGMWDGLTYDPEREEVTGIIECKTSSRPQDWENGVPEHYMLQACLYAYLKNVEKITIIVGFLTDEDYDHPEAFTPSSDNTAVFEFNLHDFYPDFENSVITPARKWWDEHVKTGISPYYDDHNDKGLLEVLRTHTLPTDDEWEFSQLLIEAETLTAKLDTVKEELNPLITRLKEIDEILKHQMSTKFREGDTKVVVEGNTYVFELSKSFRESINKKALVADDLLAKYITKTETLTLKKKKKETN